MLKPGKYDAEAEALLQKLGAEGLILIVVGGQKGSGMSVKSNPVLLAALPGLMRTVADMIELEVSEDVAQALKASSSSN